MRTILLLSLGLLSLASSVLASPKADPNPQRGRDWDHGRGGYSHGPPPRRPPPYREPPRRGGGGGRGRGYDDHYHGGRYDGRRDPHHGGYHKREALQDEAKNTIEGAVDK
ncbi:hypothetical protein CLU79DRAFT_410924 [Phycomyces nitens]|nr:hypothetical protein CLU79DRAFT_410924 [Phycomyces nitens]